MPPRPKFNTLSILVAAYNEEESLRASMEAVLAAPLPGGLAREIVHGRRTARSDAHLARWPNELALPSIPSCGFFNRSQNMGKGAAIRRAIAEMTGDLAVFQDADLEYDPNDYRTAAASPILDGQARTRCSARRFTGEERQACFTSGTRSANRFLTLLSNMLNDIEPHRHGDVLQGVHRRRR